MRSLIFIFKISINLFFKCCIYLKQCYKVHEIVTKHSLGGTCGHFLLNAGVRVDAYREHGAAIDATHCYNQTHTHKKKKSAPVIKT